MKILTLSGSLRADSLNSRLLAAATGDLGPGVEVEAWERLHELPHYDQDLDTATPPALVVELRRAVAEADALVLATPEFNGSVSGVLKNAIDWASRPRGASALAGKPAVVLTASPSPRGAQWAREDLARILGVAGVRVLGETVGVPHAHEAIDASDGLREPRVRDLVREQIDLLLADGADDEHAAA